MVAGLIASRFSSCPFLSVNIMHGIVLILGLCIARNSSKPPCQRLVHCRSHILRFIHGSFRAPIYIHQLDIPDILAIQTQQILNIPSSVQSKSFDNLPRRHNLLRPQRRRRAAQVSEEPSSASTTHMSRRREIIARLTDKERFLGRVTSDDT